MKRSTIYIGILLLAVAITGGLYAFQRFSPENPELTRPEINFRETGTIVVNNPGQTSGVWYLLREEPGAPALSSELRFTDTSVCRLNDQIQNCQQLNVPNGQQAYVEGVVQEGVVTVSMISTKTEERTVKLYYYNPTKDQGPGGAQCSRKGLEAVERTVMVTPTIIEDTINLLLGGPTQEERNRGLTTDFPLSGLTLVDASLESGLLTLQFNDPNNRTGGGACRAGLLWLQIEETAKQFPEVERVRFLPEELFQP